MKSGGSKKRKKGKSREGNIKTAKEKHDHARTNYFIVVVMVFSYTKSISVQIQPSLLAPYPGYQRFFSRAAGIFGVGQTPTYLRP